MCTSATRMETRGYCRNCRGDPRLASNVGRRSMNMGIVGTGFSMSLDGFVAGPHDDVSQVFAWIGQGDTEYTAPGGRVVYKVAAASAALLQEQSETTGALVVGRRHFDGAGGWN